MFRVSPWSTSLNPRQIRVFSVVLIAGQVGQDRKNPRPPVLPIGVYWCSFVAHLRQGEQLLAAVEATTTQGQYATFETSVELPAGAQTLRIRSAVPAQGITWIEFAK